MTYEIITDELTQNTIIQKNNLDGSISYIPMDENNSDYQAYLNKDNPVGDNR